MRFQSQVTGGLWLAVILFPAGARAETPAVLSAANPPSAVAADAGLFGGLDARSAYQQEFFPQPLLVEDTGVEPDGELEFSSLHTQAGGQRSDTVMAGAQKSFGLLTFELGVPYEWNAGGDNPAQGVGNLEVSARYPVWQWVSAQGLFDDTFGVALEAGLPVNSPVSHNAELTPKLFNDVKLGEHFSVQSVFGYATLFGGGDSGGLQTFEYGFAFAYALRAAELPIPGVRQVTPMLELSGETGLNQSAAGQNSLLASLGLRIDFTALGDLQPSFGVGLVLPVDSGARAEVQWGIATSFTVEF